MEWSFQEKTGLFMKRINVRIRVLLRDVTHIPLNAKQFIPRGSGCYLEPRTACETGRP